MAGHRPIAVGWGMPRAGLTPGPQEARAPSRDLGEGGPAGGTARAEAERHLRKNKQVSWLEWGVSGGTGGGHGQRGDRGSKKDHEGPKGKSCSNLTYPEEAR